LLIVYTFGSRSLLWHLVAAEGFFLSLTDETA